MPITRRKLTTVLAVVAAGAGAAVLAPSSPASGDHVTIKGSTLATYHFAPKRLHVEKGDTVHWSWNSNAPHNVTFKKIAAHSATGASITYKHRFKRAGTYRYVCTIHGFRGKIVVG